MQKLNINYTTAQTIQQWQLYNESTNYNNTNLIR